MPSYVVPCSAAKLDRAAPARELYASAHFAHVLAAAEAAAAFDGSQVFILSALHGLVRPDEVLAPYDVRIGDAEAITAETLASSPRLMGLVLDDEPVYSLLPSDYERVLDRALRTYGCWTEPVFEACRGIGEHRAVASSLRR